MGLWVNSVIPNKQEINIRLILIRKEEIHKNFGCVSVEHIQNWILLHHVGDG